MAGTDAADAPPARPALSVFDGIVFIVGIVVGVGLFRTPPLVAAGVDSGAAYLALWALGGLAALIGALCYAELGSAYPHAGGEYHYLTRAYGRTLGLFFVWARGTVIQTGSIAVIGFVYGDYANEILDLGRFGPAIHAATAAVLLTLLNVGGRHPTRQMQRLLTGLEIAIILVLVLAGAAITLGQDVPAAAPTRPDGAIGLAMILILLTYGGWNEAAYLSAEVEGPRRPMVRALVAGVVAVIVIYLAVNAALLAALGLDRLRASDAVAADLMRLALGEAGALALAAAICIAALSTMNATIFTGARLYYALGQETALARALGRWDERRQAPARAVLLQGAVALALIAFGAAARNGFQAMVDYTAPVFWLFMTLTGLALLVLRHRDPEAPRPFRVPFYPVTPLLFAASSAWLLYSSLAYTGLGAALGLAVLAAGIPFVMAAQRR